jgi:geranylgeranyl diphosphate synthase type I
MTSFFAKNGDSDYFFLYTHKKIVAVPIFICYDAVMFTQTKKRVDRELVRFVSEIDRAYRLKKLSPVLSASIRDFVLRPGKRVRPVLFIIGYLSFAQRPARGLYTSALSIELLHDFMLVHDDIIDKSETRRGKPSMHTLLGRALVGVKNVKFNGQDLSIVVGDVMYAMAIRAFLAIHENMERKERALKKFIEAAILTGCGEYIELMYGINDVGRIAKGDIYRVYDYKTAYYTFACPLATGAILAGASVRQVDLLSQYGLYVGRAFQIKDDILGMFGTEGEIGKSVLTDLREAKKTILIWYAFNHAGAGQRRAMKKILSKEDAGARDLAVMQTIIRETGSLEFAGREVLALFEKSQTLLQSSRLKPLYKSCLRDYAQEILKL